MKTDFVVEMIFIFLIVFTSGSLWVYYQLRNQWLEHLLENLKFRQKHYQRLIHHLSLDSSTGDEETYQKLMAQFDSLLMVASPHLIPQILEFQQFMRASNVRVLRNSALWLEQRNELSRNLILALRVDIYGEEALTPDSLSSWRPLSRRIYKSNSRFEIIPFKLFQPKPNNSRFYQQK